MGLFDGDHFGFDFDHDGRTSFFESAATYAMFDGLFDDEDDLGDLDLSFYAETDSWRDACEDGSAYGLDPDDFDSEDDYQEALDEASRDGDAPAGGGVDWREDAWVEGFEYDLDPDDYDSREDFEEALEDAEKRHDKAGQRTLAALAGYAAHAACGDSPAQRPAPAKPSRPLSEAEVLALLPCDALGISVKKPKPGRSRKGASLASYPNQRTRALALELAERMGDGPNGGAYRKELRERCEFALKNPHVPAARHITVDGDFLYAQAAREHFALPVAVPFEDETPKTPPELLVKAIARKDAQLAADVWAWLVETFVPHLRFNRFPEQAHLDLTAKVIFELSDLPNAALLEAVDRLERDEGLRAAAFATTPQPTWGLSPVLLCALANGRGRAAHLVLRDALGNASAVAAELADSLGWVVFSCTQEASHHPAELLKTHLLPLLEAAPQPELQSQLPTWNDALARYLGEKKYPPT